MFDITVKPTFTRDVKVRVPSGQGVEEQSLTATFRSLDDTELAKFDLATARGSIDFLRAVTVRLDDLSDGGKALDYSDSVRDQALGLQYVRTALAREWFEGMLGAKRGN